MHNQVDDWPCPPTSKQSANGPETQRSVIEHLHGDKHGEPDGRRGLEELVIVCIEVEIPELV